MNRIVYGDVLDASLQYKGILKGQCKLVYLDPPYNTKRSRGARKDYTDTNRHWSEFMSQVVKHACEFLRPDGFLAVSINQMELFNLKNIIDGWLGDDCFIGLFPVKIRHKDRQLMINATYHDVYEYMLFYRKQKTTRFYCRQKTADMNKFNHQILVKEKKPEKRIINGKAVEIYQPGQYEIAKVKDCDRSGVSGPFRRYVIAGKLRTANWSGEWYENHLHGLGQNLLVKVEGLEKDGLGYRWFHTATEKRRSGVYFQSLHNAGRPVLPTNDLDFTDEVTNIYKEGGPGCDFKDSKKPEKLLQFILDICTQEGDQVLDLFGGSGTTLAACLKSGRECVIVENNAKSVEIMKTRLANMQKGLDLDGVSHSFYIEESEIRQD